jgi:integrase/recombinase XerD
MFRPLRRNRKNQVTRRAMNPDAIDRVVRKFAAKIGLDRGYSAHSMRATFITTALENGAQLEDVQKAAGHRRPKHYETLRPTGIQSGEGGELLRDVLSAKARIGAGAPASGAF